MTVYSIRRAALVGALALGLAGHTVAHGQTTEEILAIIAERAAAHGVSAAYLQRVARCESTLNRWAVGRAGELGGFQLHPRGELRTFYARGYTDPTDWWEAADFTARRFAEGGSRAWSCA